jgi:hypothetical protein
MFKKQLYKWLRKLLQFLQTEKFDGESVFDLKEIHGHNAFDARKTTFCVGNVVKCIKTDRIAILTHILYLPPDRRYMYRFAGIGFDGHGWLAYNIESLAENMEEYLNMNEYNMIEKELELN